MANAQTVAAAQGVTPKAGYLTLTQNSVGLPATMETFYQFVTYLWDSEFANYGSVNGYVAPTTAELQKVYDASSNSSGDPTAINAFVFSAVVRDLIFQTATDPRWAPYIAVRAEYAGGGRTIDVAGYENILAASKGQTVSNYLYESGIATGKIPQSTLDSLPNGGHLGGVTAPSIPVPTVPLPDSGLKFDGITAGQQDFLISMYIGAFSRAPEYQGLKYWANELHNYLAAGFSQNEANLAVGKTMYQSGASNGEGGTQLGTADYVTAAYNNSLGRAPDAAGKAYWITQLDGGTITRGEFLTTFLTAAINNTGDGAYLQARIAVAEYFAQPHVSDGASVSSLKAAIAGIADSGSALNAINNVIASYGNATYGTPAIDHKGFAGSASNYTIDVKKDYSVLVNKQTNEKSILVGVERVDFADGSHVALDISGNAGQAYRLYNAAFDRTPDKSGLSYWIAQFDAGASVQQVSTSFLNSNEFKNLYGVSTTNEQFVKALYTNVLDRAPDSTGSGYWVNELASGKESRAEVLIGFANSNENVIALSGQLQHGIDYAVA